jgi:hypothetical protein
MNAGFYLKIFIDLTKINLTIYSFKETCDATEKTCPNVTGAEVSLIEYVIYLIFINILLINILIAIFK